MNTTSDNICSVKPRNKGGKNGKIENVTAYEQTTKRQAHERRQENLTRACRSGASRAWETPLIDPNRNAFEYEMDDHE